MKFNKIIFLLILFLISFGVCSCDEEEKTELELFGEQFKNAHPDGVVFDDGWYEFTSNYLSYSHEDNINYVINENFKGNCKFVDARKVDSDAFVWEKYTTKNELDKIIESGNFKMSFVNNKYNYSTESMKNNEIICETYGNDNIEFDARFEISPIIEDISHLDNLQWDVDNPIRYETVRFVKKESGVIYNYLSLTRKVNLGDRIVSIKYEYHFDDNYDIVLSTMLQQTTYLKNDMYYDPLKKRDYVVYKTFKKTNEIDISTSDNYQDISISSQTDFWFFL